MPEDSEKHECSECGDEFDTERGLKIHEGIKHKEDEEEASADEKEDVEESVEQDEKTSTAEAEEVTKSEDEEASEEKESSTFSFSLKTVAATVFILGLSAGFIAGFAYPMIADSGEDIQDEVEDANQEFTEVDLGDITLDSPSLGSSEADMKVVKLTDFSCPFCAEWHGSDASPQLNIYEEQTFDTIRDDYVDTGEVEFMLRDNPVPDRHPNSVKAHAAANCAYDQDRESYWEFVDSLYDTQDVWTAEGDNRTAHHFEEVAEGLEAVDTESFMQCYLSTDGNELAETRADTMNSLGEIGTPSFIVGNEDDGFVIITGAQPIEEFERAFEQISG